MKTELDYQVYQVRRQKRAWNGCKREPEAFQHQFDYTQKRNVDAPYSMNEPDLKKRGDYTHGT